MTQLTVNGNTYSDDGTAAKDMNNGGHRTNFLPLIQDAMADFSGKQSVAESARDIAAAAAQAAINAPGASATSTTSLTIGAGSKSLTIQTGKAFVVGQAVIVASTATPTTWMAGTITAYNSATGALTVNVNLVSGSGTLAAWTISTTAPTYPLATQAEMETGTVAEPRYLSPLLVKQAIATPRSARTSNTILGAADKGRLIDITGGTFFQTLTAAATLGNGWYCTIGNSGNGFVTLDPNGTETITVNGGARLSWALWPREMGMLVCDGVGFSYYCLQKGEITQTISSPVSGVTFATGLAYRRKMLLSVEDMTANNSNAVFLKVNGQTASKGVYIETSTHSGSNTTGTGYGKLTPNTLMKANATGTDRLIASALISPLAVNTTVESTATFSDIDGYGVSSREFSVFGGVSESSIFSVSVEMPAGGMTAGTFVLREI